MMQLRDYQIAAKSAAVHKLADHQSTLIEMATGLGKTVVFSHIANEWPGRVLIIAHRDELIRQAAEKIHAITGQHAAIEMGRERADDELFGTKVTIASVQTLARSKRRSRFHPDHFSLIICDEGHHCVAVSWQEVLEYFGSAKRLFVTATPKRGDQIALSAICESVAYQYGIEPAIDDGWLVPVEQQVVTVDGLDFSKARSVANDFNEGDLERILTEEKPLHAMCLSGHEIIGGRQALWFCATVNHAKKACLVLSRYAGEDKCRFLSGDTPTDERRDVVDAYKRGEVQHLFNCGLFLEGFDAPTTAAIVMARPTKSTALYMQILGRGTRPLPGVVDSVVGKDQRHTAIAMSLKPKMVVIDYVGNAGRHQIVQAADVLGGKYDVPVRDYAKQTMAEEGSATDIREALVRAQAELDLVLEEDSRRKRIVAGSISYRAEQISPFVKQHNPASMPTEREAPERCSDKQAWKIVYTSRQTGKGGWTFEKAKKLSKNQAQAIISRLLAEAKK